MTLFDVDDVPLIGRTVDKALVPLVFSKALPNIDVVGSGFLLTLEGRVYFATALHTITEYRKDNLCLLINDTAIPIASWELSANKASDICVAELTGPNLARVANNFKIPINRASAHLDVPFRGCTLIGFPKELNYKGRPQAQPIEAGIDMRPDTVIESDVPNSYVYNVSGKYLYDSKGNVVREPLDFHGMSGGPIFGWLQAQSDAPSYEVRTRVFLKAVIVEWEEKQGYAVGVRVGALLKVIDDMVLGN